MHNHFIHHLKEEFHKSRNIIFVLFVFCMALVFSFLSTGDMQSTSAADAHSFRPGNIISDAVMSNYQSMSVTDIQNFLSSKNKCDNRDYNLYLQYTRNQPTINWHWEGEPYNGHFVCMAEEHFGDGEVIGSGMTAAEIIHDAAQQNKINPQVLLVLLQKESSLITDKVPNDFDYRKATGYGCPDTAACDSKYYGFKNQVYRAAELFRHVLDKNSVYYPAGRNVYVGYHPNSSCGGTTVYIENRATAALYQYTPYQPNNSALNAGYGVGDVCSAYGNRNFYLYFSDWFGSTQAAVDGELITIPDGEYNLVSAVANDRSLGLSGSNAVLTTLNTSDKTQRWNIRRNATTGYYELTNVHTGQPLITQTVDPTLSTNVLSGRSTTCSKSWKIYRTKDNYLTLESACAGGITLDVYGGNSTVGTNVQTYLTNAGKSQKWQFHVDRTVEDGVYTVATSSNNASVIDANGTFDGANITLWSAHGDSNQEWFVKYDESTDSYTFTNPLSGKRLDLQGAVAKEGTNIQVWSSNDSCAQQWKLIPHDDGYAIISACSLEYALSSANGASSNGTNVQSNRHDNNLPAWHFKAAPSAPAANRSYVITAKRSPHTAIDFSSNDHNLLLWEKHGGWNQRWQLDYNSDTDDYTLANPTTNEVLDIENSAMAYNTNVLVWSRHGACNQRWKINRTEDGYYELLSACDNGYALDMYGGYLTNGTNVQIWGRHGGDAQKFVFSY